MSKGDKKAYETMFRRFYPKVHRFVAMLLKNEDDADDVSQLIFLKVWNKREKFADIQNFDSYLFILAKYLYEHETITGDEFMKILEASEETPAAATEE